MPATVTLKKYSAAEIDTPPTDCLRFFVDIADSILKSKDDLGVVRPFGVGTADELATTGAPVDVSASAPPTAGQFLRADSAIASTWQDYFGTVVQTSVQTGPSYAAAIGDLVLVDVSGGNVTVDLPTAVGNTNREIWVKLVTVAAPGTNECTVDPNGVQTIDGASTFILDTDFEWIKLRSNGANWMQVG